MTAPIIPPSPSTPPSTPPRRRAPHIPGPTIPEDMPDLPPFKLDRLEELATPNALGEIVFLVTGRTADHLPVKLIVACSPHTGAVTRAAAHLAPGAGYVATAPATLPGNLLDVVGTIALEAGAALYPAIHPTLRPQK